jgi:NTE family protein
LNKFLFKILFFIFLAFSASAFAQVTTDSSASIINLNLHTKVNLDTNNFNIFPKFYNKKKVALALSGGGARGLSQIGVLKSLEENNIVPDMIVGTSIGAIVGGLYSSGYSTDELDSITKSIDWKSKLSFSEKYQREFLFLEQKIYSFTRWFKTGFTDFSFKRKSNHANFKCTIA